MDAVSMFAQAVKPPAGSIRFRQGTVVSVDSSYTMTVTIAGSSGSVSNVKYTAAVTPIAGDGVWLVTDGQDLFAIATIETGWNAYTPTLTGWTTGAGGSFTGSAYTRLGSVVHFRALFTFGTGSAAAAAAPVMTLPVAAVNYQGHFRAMFIDSTTTYYEASARLASTTTVAAYIIGGSGVQTAPSTTTPFTWGIGDQVLITGTYEAS